VKVNEFVGGVDALVMEQRPEWKVGDALRFRGCCSGVAGVVAAAAAVAVTVPS